MKETLENCEAKSQNLQDALHKSQDELQKSQDDKTKKDQKSIKVNKVDKKDAMKAQPSLKFDDEEKVHRGVPPASEAGDDGYLDAEEKVVPKLDKMGRGKAQLPDVNPNKVKVDQVPMRGESDSKVKMAKEIHFHEPQGNKYHTDENGRPLPIINFDDPNAPRPQAEVSVLKQIEQQEQQHQKKKKRDTQGKIISITLHSLKKQPGSYFLYCPAEEHYF